MERALIIGSNGQLGTELTSHLAKSYSIDALTHEDIDITKDVSLIRDLQPKYIINTAAYHHMEKCEENPERSFQVNAIGPLLLSKVANELDATLVHFSTDYVFDGAKRKPYIESDCAAPLNVYGNSKLAGEHFIRTTAHRYFVVRVSAIYGHSICRAKGENFIEKMLRLAETRDVLRVVDNEFVTPTYTLEIAEQIELLFQTNEYGVYHLTCEGSCSWYEFAKMIFQEFDVAIELQVAEPGEFAGKVARPEYSVLENHHLKLLSLNRVSTWQDALKRYKDIRHGNIREED